VETWLKYFVFVILEKIQFLPLILPALQEHSPVTLSQDPSTQLHLVLQSCPKKPSSHSSAQSCPVLPGGQSAFAGSVQKAATRKTADHPAALILREYVNRGG